MVGTVRDWTVFLRVRELTAWSRLRPNRPGLNLNQANFSHLVGIAPFQTHFSAVWGNTRV